MRALQKQIITALPLVAAIMLLALGSPGNSEAATPTANTTILNVVKVDYKDASGTNSFAATASSFVTILLVKAPATASGIPTAAGGGSPALACPAAGSFTSGTTVSALYALYASANGLDTYNLSMANTPTNATATVNYSTLNYQGLSPTLNPPSVALGSAIPTGAKSADTLYFPGGSLTTAGFAVNDIVLVDLGAGGKKAFLVASVVNGSAASHSNLGSTGQTTVGTTTAEVKGELQLKAYTNQSITLNGASVTFGGNVTPAFTTTGTVPTPGLPVGEMVLVQIDVTATLTLTLDGSVSYTLSNGATTLTTCSVGSFKATALTISKRARNVTASGSFAASATGNPGNILEYEVSVSNSGGQATQVIVTDAVPAYTSLVSFTGSYGSATPGTGVAANFFAKITDNAGPPNVVNITMDGTVGEAQPLATAVTGFGKAPGTAALSPITFYLGDTATFSAGGKIPTCSDNTYLTSATCTGAGKSWLTSYTILYQVKID